MSAVPPLRVAVVKAVRASIAPAFLRSTLQAACGEPPVAARLPVREGGCELTLRITGDRELRRLNRDFLGEDAPTDVLSFPSGTVGPSGTAGGYLGDLALSWPAVVRQAAAFGHPPAAEAALLSVHGLLHLLGWDHATTAEENEMWALSHDCLRRAGVEVAGGRLSSSSRAGGAPPAS